MATPTKGSITQRVLQLLLAALLLAALLELSARVNLFGLAGLVPARVNSVHGLPHTGFTQPSQHPEIAFELKPNVDDYFKLVPFRTNSRGLRDEEHPLEKPDGRFRIAVLGSSFTLPAGVEIERAYHSLLEARFDEERGTPTYEFINFAVGAYDPGQMLATLEAKALAYEPDLIVFAMTRLSTRWLVSDRPVATPRAFTEYAGVRTYPFLQSFLLATLEARSQPVGGPVARTPRIGLLERGVIRLVGWWSGDVHADAVAGRPWHIRAPASIELRESVIPRLGEISAHTGIPVLVVNLEFNEKKFPPPATLRAEIGDVGLHFVNTRSAFEGTRASDFWIHPLDPHPNAAAHVRFADVIERFLRENQLMGGERS